MSPVEVFRSSVSLHSTKSNHGSSPKHTASTAIMTKAVGPRPMNFLSLAPATSSSYPQPQTQRLPVLEGSAIASGSLEGDIRPAVQRRSSSVSSTGFKILKLGPVHWGEHLGDDAQKSDFVDVPSP
ncbi:hypothetical protein LIA77_00933 [Sarocladium implicatum]|nr:hypothetical protein LIA77_00933 [Sarocladium implicatum]